VVDTHTGVDSAPPSSTPATARQKISTVDSGDHERRACHPPARPAAHARPRRPPDPAWTAFAEYGRIAKTLHLLAVVDPVDETYRRSVHRQLTIQESHHRLAHKIFHGQRGELRQPYREGQEDQLGALGLVRGAVVLWNTRYTDTALAALRSNDPVDDADAARLSPLGHHHVNVRGRYAFTPRSSPQLRPLHDPATADDE